MIDCGDSVNRKCLTNVTIFKALMTVVPQVVLVSLFSDIDNYSFTIRAFFMIYVAIPPRQRRLALYRPKDFAIAKYVRTALNRHWTGWNLKVDRTEL